MVAKLVGIMPLRRVPRTLRVRSDAPDKGKSSEGRVPLMRVSERSTRVRPLAMPSWVGSVPLSELPAKASRVSHGLASSVGSEPLNGVPAKLTERKFCMSRNSSGGR